MKNQQTHISKGILVVLGLILPFIVGACEGLQNEADPSASGVLLEGTYTSQQNTCKNDGSDLTITQDINTLLMKGGFDYLESSPDEFDGFVDEDGVIRFTFEEGDPITCSATLADSILYGTCSFGSNTCNFAFTKKSAN